MFLRGSAHATKGETFAHLCDRRQRLSRKIDRCETCAFSCRRGNAIYLRLRWPVFGVMRRRQFVTTQPVVIFFSAAYLAAASLTIGAMMESSALIQSDAIFHFLPSQVWMRPVRVPS